MTLKEEIRAILTHNAGRIPERLESDLELIIQKFLEAVPEKQPLQDPEPHKPLLPETDINMPSPSIYMQMGFNKAVDKITDNVLGAK